MTTTAAALRLATARIPYYTLPHRIHSLPGVSAARGYIRVQSQKDVTIKGRIGEVKGTTMRFRPYSISCMLAPVPPEEILSCDEHCCYFLFYKVTFV